MFIPIILGTAREGRQSEKAANFIFKEVEKYGLETEIIDVRDYPASATDNSLKTEKSKKLSEKIEKADGLIIVSPEYNHSYPGELKLLLDSLYKQYFYKPVGICGVSAGPLGGARMAEQLRLVFVELHMVPIREAVYFPSVQNLFDEDNVIKDQAYSGRIKILLDELTWYAKALKEARNNK